MGYEGRLEAALTSHAYMAADLSRPTFVEKLLFT